MNSTALTGSFVAVDKENNQYKILILTELVGYQRLEGLKTLTTETGLHVNKLKSGHYQILTEDFFDNPQIDIFTDDPDAP